MGPDSGAFVTALVISFIDQSGDSFTEPVRVPYGCLIGAKWGTIAWCATARGICSIFSALWLPSISAKHGRKSIIALALFGRSLGFFMQGAANSFPMLVVGCGVAGIFSGSAPVICAYITEISGHNRDTLERRFSVLHVTSQMSGMVLKPIAGSLAWFGLQLPFFVCSGLKLFGCLWALFAFREASDLVSPIHGAAMIAMRRSNLRQAQPWNLLLDKTVMLDKVIVLSFLGFFSLSIVACSLPFMIPRILAGESLEAAAAAAANATIVASTAPNGTEGVDDLQRETNHDLLKLIAWSHGIASLPYSVCSIFVSTFVHSHATEQFGELAIFLIAGVSCGIMYASVGFWVSGLGHILIIQLFGGMCFGLFLPMVGPLIRRYPSHNHRTKYLVVQAMGPFVGQLAAAVSWNLMALIIDFSGNDGPGDETCWVFNGLCMLAFTVILSCAFKMVDKEIRLLSELSTEQRKMRLNSIHPPEDVDVVINAIVGDVRKLLNERRGELWNGTAQFLYKEALENSLKSKFRAWNDATQGREYLQDMLAVLSNGYPDELEEFQRKFPHVALPRRDTYSKYSFEAGSSFVVGGFCFGSSGEGQSLSQSQSQSQSASYNRSRLLQSQSQSDAVNSSWLNRSRISLTHSSVPVTESASELSSEATSFRQIRGTESAAELSTEETSCRHSVFRQRSL